MKINIVFDLDETLVSATNSLNDFNIVCVFENKKKNPMKIVFREGVVELFHLLDKFCNFFVVTNGVETYAKEVLILLNKLSKFLN